MKSYVASLFVLAAVAVFLIPTEDAAAGPIVNFTALLSGENEVPPVDSDATGSATVSLDTDTLLLSWDISWSGLTGPAVGMHFHGPAEPTENAGVQLSIGAISGLTSPSVGDAVITEDQASQLLGDLWYINVHTAAFPAGEIRGQVLRVAEPAALTLFGVGVMAMVALGRRRIAH